LTTNAMTPFMAELIGTMLLIILGDGVVANVVLHQSKAQNAGWIVVALAWGLAVAIAAYSVGSYSGAHLNPALTLGLAASGTFAWDLVPGYLLAQFLGAFLGAVVVYLHFLPHFKATPDPAGKLAVFCTAPAIRQPLANLLSEFVGTFVLVLGISAIGANQLAQGLNPLLVGLLVVGIGLSLGGTTGYAINPARDLAPRLAHFLLPIAGKGSSDLGYAWVPVAGPVLGGLYGAVFYQHLFKGTDQGLLFWGLSLLAALLAVGALVRDLRG
jgi:glycerol uptake facilitator protein